ncbi:MAG: 30S ribosomal protein S20 [Clostridiales Family XIII bacterium]|jgi:small subunit ribosomal protein S20|nr:30S ribosomal protein S20 [Clostridiales Family XIII bacterium]
MANIKSAKKRINVTEVRTARNKRIKNRIKALLKEYELSLTEKNEKDSREKFILLERKIAQAASKGVYKKNTAARKISSIASKFNSIFKKSA